MTKLPKYIEDILLLDPLENCNMLGFFRFHDPTKVIRINTSLMVCGLSDELWWYIHCDSRDDYCQFLEKHSNGKHFFAVLSDWMLGELEARFDISWTLSCIKFYLPNEVLLPENNLTLSDLLPEDTQCIFENSNYQAFTNPEYIANQLRMRTGVAYRDGNTLAGWAMFHDDGALGLLHVLDKYRRKGIARALVIELCNRLRAQNQIPYTSVEPTNDPSLKMVQSLGFVPLGNIHWVCFE